MDFLIIPIDEGAFRPWVKYNNKEEWDAYAKSLLPYSVPRRDPEGYPCFAKEVCERTKWNKDELIHCFVYQFTEKTVCQGEECDPAFNI